MTGKPTVTLDTKDSGQREEFPTGSRRDTREGKGRYDLLSPLAIRRLALVLERGAVKYGDRNWERGQPLSRYLDSCLRHVFQYLSGNREEDHLAQAMWNLHAALHTEEQILSEKLPVTLNDLPEYVATPSVFDMAVRHEGSVVEPGAGETKLDELLKGRVVRRDTNATIGVEPKP